MTNPGEYAEMLEHVAVHRYFMGLERERDVPWTEAVRSWYETLYRPMTETIRASGVLEDFPRRTEADLYLFTARHLHELRMRFGDGVAPERAVEHFRLTMRRDRAARARLEERKEEPAPAGTEPSGEGERDDRDGGR